jgi:hypothetical protein
MWCRKLCECSAKEKQEKEGTEEPVFSSSFTFESGNLMRFIIYQLNKFEETIKTVIKSLEQNLEAKLKARNLGNRERLESH